MDELITDSDISLDLKEGTPIPLNLSISDFREPDKRQRNFSKEIDLPGTAKNQKFFASAFQATKLAGVFDFNSSAKVNCKYYKNGILVLANAIIKLNKVVILDKEITFKVTLFSDVVDIFLTLSNTDVRDLDWSAYDHTLNNANIIATFGSPTGSGYYYPLIERNQRTSISGWKNTDMIPYVYLVEVFTKCMELVGQKFTSNFISNNARLKKILFGYGGGNYVDSSLPPIELNNRKVILNNGIITWAENRPINLAAGVTSFNGTVLFNPIPLTHLSWITNTIPLLFNVVQDINNQFTPSVFIAGKTGNYKITITGSIRVEYLGTFTYNGSPYLPGNFAYVRNGIAYPLVGLAQVTTDDTFNINISFNLTLNQGDSIEYLIDPTGVTYNVTASTVMTKRVTSPTPLQITYESLDTAVQEGNTVEVGRFLPSMRCSDFVLGFMRMFKLMISDADIYGVVTIEPEINFYQGTNVYTDISKEVDNKKEIEVRSSANEYAKTLTYKFKQGTETDAKNYISKWITPYGDLSFDQPSFFAKGEQKIELPFGTIIPYQIYPSLIAPRFVDVDTNGVKKTTSGVPRIMMRNPMKNGAWQLIGTSATNNLIQYPAVHHFDDFDNPTFDLSFKLVSEVYYAATIVTTHNLYSEFYERFVQMIISPEGKYFQLYRKMTSLQVEKLDWSKPLMWNGALFIFNKILDFDDEITQVTKIEIIKVIEANNPPKGPIRIKKSFLPASSAVVAGALDGIGIDTPLVVSGNHATLTSSNLVIG